MNTKFILLTSVACGLVLLVVLGSFFSDDKAPEPVPEVVQPPAVRAVKSFDPVPEVIPAAPVDIPPEIPEPEVIVQEPPPLPDTDSQPEPVTLPELNSSDSFVQEQISNMDNRDAISSQLTNNQIISKFVVLIDGMSRNDVPVRDLPVNPSLTSLSVIEQGEEVFRLDPASYNRFNLLVDSFAAVDNEQLIASFQLMAPLFEAAFAQLGYPDRSFNKALQESIDNVLAIGVPEREILLTRPSVNYYFLDPGLESLSDLEKLFIRMGPENAAKVQRKISEINRLLND